jgi:hypothetical protein
MYQHSDRVHAPVLYVPFLHQISSQPNCFMCALSGCQSGRTTQEARTCHQSSTHDYQQGPASPGYQFRGEVYYQCQWLFEKINCFFFNFFTSRHMLNRLRSSFKMKTFFCRRWVSMWLSTIHTLRCSSVANISSDVSLCSVFIVLSQNFNLWEIVSWVN